MRSNNDGLGSVGDAVMRSDNEGFGSFGDAVMRSENDGLGSVGDAIIRSDNDGLRHVDYAVMRSDNDGIGSVGNAELGSVGDTRRIMVYVETTSFTPHKKAMDNWSCIQHVRLPSALAKHQAIHHPGEEPMLSSCLLIYYRNTLIRYNMRIFCWIKHRGMTE